MAPIDWSAPWFHPWREPGAGVVAGCQAGQAVHEALSVARSSTAAPNLRFGPQQILPAGEPYERYIFEQGVVPTRDNAHDFFNGLVWLGLPQAKRRMNQLQAAEIAMHGVGAARGPVRDALTVFDENGAVLMAPDALWEALLARDWQRLFVDLRVRWCEARLLVCGHALLEQLQRPRKGLTAHVWRAQAGMMLMAELDDWLAGQLLPERLARKPFTPLPVLGIPGWCAENQANGFYDDTRVFRPARARAQAA
ncbi:DUF3025 domain-containing protein [Hylemonella gracilis]|uniref:DUF3025 domain-containing protein n=1 Tax=Hylemonella gracilis TaxID=80880 RepID=A0A4P6UQE9_9BURK|nr:DUF3025 domain-containing protein [Hylemonella gracilis]QBK06405.1 DUF3025 domain-containing protein [Hylemonella gracilis]